MPDRAARGRRRRGALLLAAWALLSPASRSFADRAGEVAAAHEPSSPRTEAAAQAAPEASAKSRAAGDANHAPAADLSALLAGMRSSRGVVAAFTETKELALLSSPLEATGVIYFVPPSRLVRVVTSPGRSRLVVDGDRVRLEDENGSRELDLSASPIARQLIDSFVVLFNGDEARLKQLYDAEFHADGDRWTLRLLPRSMPLSRMIASFEMQGSDSRIDRMDSVEPDGDRTVTRFGESDVQHQFTAAELTDLFGDAAAKK